MGPEWLNEILQWIGAHPALAGIAICFIAFLEGLALIGIVIPGIIILFGVGALVGLDILRLESVWFWTSLGAILGDGVSFWIGHHFKQHLREIWPFTRFRNLINRGEQFFRRHGSKSIIIGRFVGPVRPIMPVVAGMMGMDLRRYIPANIVAGFLFAPAYLLPGVVFGASIELAQAVALRLALLLCLVIGLGWSLIWLVQQAYYTLAPRTSRMLAFAMKWSHAHPRLGRVTRNLVDPSQPESGTLALFALVLILATWGALTLAIAIPVAGGPFTLDRATLALMSELRSPWADQLMALFNGFGDYGVLLPASALVLIWLAWRRRVFAAGHWAVAVAFALVLSALISYVVEISRGAVIPQAPGEALGLMHITLSVVIYGFFGVLISRELPRRRRVWPYMLAALLVGLIAFSRLYFGAHWLTDVLVGTLFGTLWVAVLGIAYRRRVRRSFWTAPVAAIFFGTVAVGVVAYGWYGTDRLVAAYASRLPEQTVAAQRWWDGDITLPLVEDRARLNVQYAGSLGELRETLGRADWQPARAATWETLFEMIQPRPGFDTLPLLPAALNGRSESLLLHRRAAESGEQWVLRLWPSGLTTADGDPVWVGHVDRYGLDRVAWFFAYWARLHQRAPAIAELSGDLAAFETAVRDREHGPWLYLRRGNDAD